MWSRAPRSTPCCIAPDTLHASHSCVGTRFELQPLNRGDAYTVRLFIVAAGERPNAISVSSSEAIKFTEIPSVAETSHLPQVRCQSRSGLSKFAYLDSARVVPHMLFNRKRYGIYPCPRCAQEHDAPCGHRRPSPRAG